MAEEQKSDEGQEAGAISPLTFKEFLEDVSPGVFECVPDALSYSERSYVWTLKIPELRLHCRSEDCNDMRLFSCNQMEKESSSGYMNLYLIYKCKNCGRGGKTYAINTKIIERDVPAKDGEKGVFKEEVPVVFKYGEFPSFGLPTSNRVLDMMGVHRDDFLKGRRCENQGLGKGAFTYYRNVVEDQKQALIDEIIKVAKILRLLPEDIKVMEEAKKETQFSKAVENIKHLIPESLLIKGHNPLTLLHDALSKGIHPNLTDEECLGYATSIRTILVALCEKVKGVTKDDKDINSALKQLTGNGGGTTTALPEESSEHSEKNES
jgi:hypothetical protein